MGNEKFGAITDQKVPSVYIKEHVRNLINQYSNVEILEGIQAPFLVWDQKFNLIAFNNQLLKIFRMVDHNESIDQLFSSCGEHLKNQMLNHLIEVVKTQSVSSYQTFHTTNGQIVQTKLHSFSIQIHDKDEVILTILDEMQKENTYSIEHFNDDFITRCDQGLGIFEYDVLNDKWSLSNCTYELLGITKEELTQSFTSETFLSTVHSDDLENIKTAIGNIHTEKKPQFLHFRVKKKNGMERILQLQLIPHLDKNDQLVKITGAIADVTKIVNTEKRLKEKENMLQSIFHHLDIALWSFDVRKNQLIYCSDAVEKIFGISKSYFEREGNNWKTFIHPEDFDKVMFDLSRLRNGNCIRTEFRIINTSDQTRWLSIQIAPILNEKNELEQVTGFITDITNKKEYEINLHNLKRIDPITFLPNRMAFNETVERLVTKQNANSQMFAVYCLDLDEFKRINDTLGHIVGDQVLNITAKRIKKVIGNKGVVYRTGGDEFIVLLQTGQKRRNYLRIAQLIIEEIEKPILINQEEVFISSSIGISLYPKHGKSSEELLLKGKAALYKAKGLGKGNYQLYSANIPLTTYHVFQIEKDLRYALKYNEFTIVYQPKIHTKTKEIAGFEALIRWHHSKKGLIMPNKFISIAEESGLITTIDDWMFKEVCKQLKEWQEKGIQVVPVSINISPKRLIKENFYEFITQTMEQNGISPDLIVLEVTERSLLQDEEQVLHFIKNIKKLGIKIALDDFGIGYSAINYLKKFPIDLLKIDRSFIANIDKDQVDLAITKTLIDLAHALGMKVVAEGVETYTQYSILNDLQCDEIQGFLFGKPISSGKITTFFFNRQLP